MVSIYRRPAATASSSVANNTNSNTINNNTISNNNNGSSMMTTKRGRKISNSKNSNNGIGGVMVMDTKRKETLSAIGLLGIVIVYIVGSVVWSTSSHQDSPNNVRHSYIPRLHIHNDQQHENNEFFDAIAQDIITTLDCYHLLSQQTYSDVPKHNQTAITRTNHNNTNSKNDNHFIFDGEGYIDARRTKKRKHTPKIMANGLHLFCLAAFEPTANETWYWRTDPKHRIQCYDQNNDDNYDNKKDDMLLQYQRSIQEKLLLLWSQARSEFYNVTTLLQTLQVATEQDKTLVLDHTSPTNKHNYNMHFWAPSQDDGTEYMLRTFNDAYKANIENGGTILGIQPNLGGGKLFVDIGSGLGYTSMLITLLYPGTDIVSVEAAPPNWLLQQMNWICHANLWPNGTRTVLLGGIGPSTQHTQMSQFVWNSQDTSSTRSWMDDTKKKVDDNQRKEEEEERNDDDGTENTNNDDNDDLNNNDHNLDDDTDIGGGDRRRRGNQGGISFHVNVKLKPWHVLQQEAGIVNRSIDVLNVDCEGCEYNLIPSLTEEEYQKTIRTVIGSIHWGYIPPYKLPSSSRGNLTHYRLCQHENFARTAKECCSYLQIPIISSIQDEMLIQYNGGENDKNIIIDSSTKTATVQDVIPATFCQDFDQWAIEHSLDTIESDYGWFQMSGPE